MRREFTINKFGRRFDIINACPVVIAKMHGFHWNENTPIKYFCIHTATCDKEDVFDIKIGVSIAVKKCLLNYLSFIKSIECNSLKRIDNEIGFIKNHFRTKLEKLSSKKYDPWVTGAVYSTDGEPLNDKAKEK